MYLALGITYTHRCKHAIPGRNPRRSLNYYPCLTIPCDGVSAVHMLAVCNYSLPTPIIHSRLEF